MARRGWAWIPLVLYSLAVVLLSHVSQPPVPPGPWNDKALHVVEYTGLGLVATLAFLRGLPRPVSLWVPFVFTALFGATDELHQSWIVGRDASFRDWLADVAGGLVAVAAVAMVRRWTRR